MVSKNSYIETTGGKRKQSERDVYFQERGTRISVAGVVLAWKRGGETEEEIGGGGETEKEIGVSEPGTTEGKIGMRNTRGLEFLSGD